MEEKDTQREDDIYEHLVYVVRYGVSERIEPPKTGFGKVEINYQNGNITHIRETQTRK